MVFYPQEVFVNYMKAFLTYLGIPTIPARYLTYNKCLAHRYWLNLGKYAVSFQCRENHSCSTTKPQAVKTAKSS